MGYNLTMIDINKTLTGLQTVTNTGFNLTIIDINTYKDCTVCEEWHVLI